MSPNLNTILKFLTHCFDDLRLGYSAMNTVRSALSAFIVVDNHPAGAHPMVVRFIKGVYQSKPSIPRNLVTWDVSIVLRFIKTLSPVGKLTLKNLTLKTATLAALLTGQRAQSLFFMNIKIDYEM